MGLFDESLFMSDRYISCECDLKDVVISRDKQCQPIKNKGYDDMASVFTYLAAYHQNFEPLHVMPITYSFHHIQCMGLGPHPTKFIHLIIK